MTNPATLHDGVPAAMNFFTVSVVLPAAGDCPMLVRGLSTTEPIARLGHVLSSVRIGIPIFRAATSVPQVLKSRTFAFRRVAGDLADFLDNPPASYKGDKEEARLNESCPYKPSLASQAHLMEGT